MIDSRIRWMTLLVLVVASFSAVGLSQPGGGDATLHNVTYAGDAEVQTDGGELVVWRDGPHRFDATLSSDSGLDGGSLCLYTGSVDAQSDAELACRSVTVEAGSSTVVTVEFDAWQSNETGNLSVRAVVRPGDGEQAFDESSTAVTVLERDGDVDEDGLANERETSLGTDLWGNDTDGDGLDDGMEVGAFGTDPASHDTDGDGLVDREELRTDETDPTAADSDGEGLDDAREVTIGTNPNVADTDGDGLDDALEVNTYGTDPTAADSDGDGISDGAEVNSHGTNPMKRDTDGDGLADNLEVITYETDPNAIDTDGDGLQDGAEVHEHRTDPTATDSDGDDLSDGEEVNVYGTNPNKADTDGDGLADGAEVDRYETDPNAADTDGDGVSDSEQVTDSGTTHLSDPALLGALGAILALGVGFFAARSKRPLSTVVRGTLFDVDLPGERGTDQSTGDGSARGQTDEVSPHGRTSLGESSRVDEKTPDTEAPAEPAGGDGAGSGDVDFDLLPNTEVVLSVLEANDGQIRQAELVEETGWSKAKVSRVLSKMEADEEVVKVSVGRGNLVTTPDDVPSGARSPFED